MHGTDRTAVLFRHVRMKSGSVTVCEESEEIGRAGSGPNNIFGCLAVSEIVLLREEIIPVLVVYDVY